MKYAKLFSRSKTPQMQPIPGAGQVRNSALGYAWNVDRWTLLDRFLILGSEDGTYYIGERKLTAEHASNAIEAIKEDGIRVVRRIVEISEAGRAPKNDPAIFALALAATYGNDETRTAAFGALPRVCRTGTHLFAFAEACEALRGWGRGLRKAIGRWYNDQAPAQVAYQMVKYGQRAGWSHRDLLRLAHPVPSSDAHKALYKWAVDGVVTGEMPLIEAAERAKSAGLEEALVLIRERKLPREALPTEMLIQAKVWEALLEDMPMTAMIRNLGNMSKCELLVGGSDAARKVVAEISDSERLRKARVHPLTMLNAMFIYAQGCGVRGSGSWRPVPSVIDALDGAFYRAFDNVKPTGKRLLLGLDVSGSMAGTRVSGMAAMECRQAAGAMALVTAATETDAQFVAFDTAPYPLAISKRQRLDDVVKLLARTGGGGTDCSAPIEYATKKKIKIDAFVIYTDSETWWGNMHPAQAMEQYRRVMGIDAKLIVVAMAANRFTIGNPTDPLTLTVVGFDTAVPQVIQEFIGS